MSIWFKNQKPLCALCLRENKDYKIKKRCGFCASLGKMIKQAGWAAEDMRHKPLLL